MISLFICPIWELLPTQIHTEYSVIKLRFQSSFTESSGGEIEVYQSRFIQAVCYELMFISMYKYLIILQVFWILFHRIKAEKICILNSKIYRIHEQTQEILMLKLAPLLLNYCRHSQLPDSSKKWRVKVEPLQLLKYFTLWEYLIHSPKILACFFPLLSNLLFLLLFIGADWQLLHDVHFDSERELYCMWGRVDPFWS